MRPNIPGPPGAEAVFVVMFITFALMTLKY